MPINIEPDSEVESPSQQTVKELEDAYDLQLPDAYKKLLAYGNGGKPVERTLETDDLNLELDFFLPIVNKGVDLGDFDVWTVEAVDAKLGNLIASFPDRPGMQLFPFALLPGDCLFCFDYREVRANPPVVYWHSTRARPYEPNTIPIAVSFDEFLKMLH